MQCMVANETGPGSFCCLSWQSVPWLVLPAMELTGCQAPCACVCVCALLCVCGLASQSSAETNASATQGWNFRLFLYTHCWLWEARPEPTDRSGFFLKVCFLASAHGIPVVELRFQSFSWPMTFFKKGQGIYHTFCVYIYVIYHTMNC